MREARLQLCEIDMREGQNLYGTLSFCYCYSATKGDEIRGSGMAAAPIYDMQSDQCFERNVQEISEEFLPW